MNKRRLLNFAMCSLLLGSLPVGLVGCKDYDDDITDINTTTGTLGEKLTSLESTLSSQVSSLQTALSAAQNAADAAGKDAAAAAEKADAATQEAALAKQAVEQAKAEAIAESLKEVEALKAQLSEMKDANDKALGNLSDELKDQLLNVNNDIATKYAELSGKINGIEEGLSKIDLTDINNTIGDLNAAIAGANKNIDALKETVASLTETIAESNRQISAMEIQVSALEKFKEEVGNVAALKDKVAKIDGILSDINNLSGDVAGLKTETAKIAGILSDLKKVQGSASANASAIKANDAAIKAIQKDLKDNYASITKVSSMISTELTNQLNQLATILSRRLSSVTLIPDLYVGGIPTISFESAKYTKKVFRNNEWVPATTGQVNWMVTNNETTAKYRLNPSTIKTEDIDVDNMIYVTSVAQTRASHPVVDVKKAEVKNGELVVNLGKGKNTESLNLSDGKIYQASLKVPVAANRLFKGETEAAVYSEFTRLEETYFRPELRFVKNAALPVGARDEHLCDSVALYASLENTEIAKNIVYNTTCDLNKLVEGCKVFSATNHQNLSVEELAKYGFGIKYAVATRPYRPSSPDMTNQQDFAKIDGSILTPKSVSNQVGNQNIIGKQPIIRATLYDKTNNNVIEVGYFKVKFTAEDMADKTIKLEINSNAAPCTGAEFDFTWDYMAKEVLEELNNKQGMSKHDFATIYTGYRLEPGVPYHGTVTVDPRWGNYDAATPIMKWVVTPNELSTLHVGANTRVFKYKVTFLNFQGLYPDVVLDLEWTVNTNVNAITLGSADPIKWDNNTMKVTVVPMNLPYDGTQTAEYNTNILEARNKPYVNGLLSCANYNIAYAPASQQTESYLGQPLTGFTPWTLTAANQSSLNRVNYVIANTAQGKALASKGGTIKVNWDADINGLAANRYTFGTINLQVVKILDLSTTTASSITDNSSEVTMNLNNNIVIKDAYGNRVAQSGSNHEADYWRFYVMQNPVFDAANIKVSATADGANGKSLAELNMTAAINNTSGVLTFKNNGSAITSDAYLIVPVSIAHKWGVLKGNVIVPLKKRL